MIVCCGERLLLKRESNLPETLKLRHLFACLIIAFSGLMNAQTMLNRQYQLSVIFQVNRAKKQIKNEMRMRLKGAPKKRQNFLMALVK